MNYVSVFSGYLQQHELFLHIIKENNTQINTIREG